MKRFRRAVTGSRVASVLQLLALAVVVAVVFHFFGLWFAALAFAGAIVLVSFAIDGGSK